MSLFHTPSDANHSYHLVPLLIIAITATLVAHSTAGTFMPKASDNAPIEYEEFTTTLKDLAQAQMLANQNLVQEVLQSNKNLVQEVLQSNQEVLQSNQEVKSLVKNLDGTS